MEDFAWRFGQVLVTHRPIGRAEIDRRTVLGKGKLDELIIRALGGDHFHTELDAEFRETRQCTESSNTEWSKAKLMGLLKATGTPSQDLHLISTALDAAAASFSISETTTPLV